MSVVHSVSIFVETGKHFSCALKQPITLSTILGWQRLTSRVRTGSISRHLVRRFSCRKKEGGGTKPRSCCLRGPVLKPPVRLPGPLPNPETWRRTAPKRMDRSQNWTRWPPTTTSPSPWTWRPRRSRKTSPTEKHGEENLISSCLVWVMQLDWGTCGDFPISAGKTAEVNTSFTVHVCKLSEPFRSTMHMMELII